MGEPDSTGVFQQRLENALWGFLRKHFGKIASGIGGVVVGGVGMYVALWTQIGDAKLASAMALKASGDTAVSVAELKQDIAKLVTTREMDTANERIGTLEELYGHAKQEAGTPPVPRRRR